jgi:hypothetical protein
MKTYIKTLLFAILLMSSISLKAQNRGYSDAEIESSPADPSSGDPGAPIDDYLFPMLGISLFMGGYLIIYKKNLEFTKGDK